MRALQEQGQRVAFVGDGINDAPALMQADIGLAIGAGTDIAIESSDIVLVGERLTAVADARAIGVSSYRKTKQNLTIAFLFNGIGVPAAVTGYVHPVWAMIAMISSVSTVLLNSFGARLRPQTLLAVPPLARRSLGGLRALLQPQALRSALERRTAAGLAILAGAFTAGVVWTVALGHVVAGMGATAGPVPVVGGFADGGSVSFVHTESSSAKVAGLLTRMTRSPVLVVPQLAHLPGSARANVYVFANGVKGGGPLGFQPDVFDCAPGTAGYSPLRTLNLVRWASGVKPRELRSAADVQAAAARGELRLQRQGVVVDMPILRASGLQRAEVR